MTSQSELHLENQLIENLQNLGYDYVELRTEQALLANLKEQIEKVNNLPVLSNNEWTQVLHHLKGGTIFDKAQKLRDAKTFTYDDGTESRHIHLLFENVEDNVYQVTNQVTIDNRYNSGKKEGRKSRFDVTILVNGLPLAQIELKKRGMEISEAFNQTQRYIKEAYWVGQGLFNYIQLFVISNGANTRYYSNGTNGMEFVFHWTDIDNKAISDLTDFTPAFLNPTHLTEMINDHIILNQSNKRLMVLRPYQVYAVEEIIERVKNTDKNGYIWHTTGAGKTLTSFQASKVIQKMPDVAKVLFVVDRKDLDAQTKKEFNSFVPDSVDDTDNTRSLVKQLKQSHSKLILTTLQKLNRAIVNDKYLDDIAYLRDEKVVLIFDECHRSQFGETHRNIKRFFNKAQMFGFTGTPIFKDNSVSKGGLNFTTEYLFDELLHSYLIVDAIRDKNVLPFRMFYWGKYTSTSIDGEKVEAINTSEVYNNPERIGKITEFIINNHDKYTKNRTFSALFCVSSIDMLIQYYDLFEKLQKKKQQHDEDAGKLFNPLKIATIFSFDANEARIYDENGTNEQSDIQEESVIPTDINQSKRDKLDSYISHYNGQFGTNYNSGDSLSEYHSDIAKRVRGEDESRNKIEKVDILIVVNMFLTGFSAPLLNTMYVDKNLKQHGLIQAFSRTNRLLNKQKPFGNIICFRNLKQATDEALLLFANKDSKATVFIPSYDTLEAGYDKAVADLYKITSSSQAVDDLLTEEDTASFILAFREVMRSHNQLSSFIEYEQDKTALNVQEFNNFTSKYKDLKDSLSFTDEKDKVSILDDIDFQLELLHSDNVNVGYIINLLQHIVDAKTDEQKRKFKAQAMDMLGGEISLHDKKELIQKFIDENIPKLITGESVAHAFSNFWDIEKENAYHELCKSQNLKIDKFESILNDYKRSERLPRIEQMEGLADYPISLFKRTDEFNRLLNHTHRFINNFYDKASV